MPGVLFAEAAHDIIQGDWRCRRLDTGYLKLFIQITRPPEPGRPAEPAYDLGSGAAGDDQGEMSAALPVGLPRLPAGTWPRLPAGTWQSCTPCKHNSEHRWAPSCARLTGSA